MAEASQLPLAAHVAKSNHHAVEVMAERGVTIAHGPITPVEVDHGEMVVQSYDLHGGVDDGTGSAGHHVVIRTANGIFATVTLAERGRRQLATWAASGDLLDQQTRLARELADYIDYAIDSPAPGEMAEQLIRQGWRYLGA